MALIICTDCNREFSDKAVACPGCGCPAPQASQPSAAQVTQQQPQQASAGRLVFVGLLSLLLLLVFLGFMFHTPSHEEEFESGRQKAFETSKTKGEFIEKQKKYIHTGKWE